MNRLLDALQGNSSNDIRVYDVNKEKAIRLLKGAGTKPAGGLFLSDDFNNSITADGSPVKNRIDDVTKIKEIPASSGKYATLLAQSTSTFGNRLNNSISGDAQNRNSVSQKPVGGGLQAGRQKRGAQLVPSGG